MCYSALVKRDLAYLGKKYGPIVIREQVDDYLRAAAGDPKRFPPLEDRIYPGHYAPVIEWSHDEYAAEIMRYGAYPPPYASDPKKYTTFNARRDNLTSSFWSGAFMRHHGYVVLAAFYEWVAVQDLLRAGVVNLDLVKDMFAKQADERRAKVLAAGKVFKPTPTELKDPRFRKIIIEFRPKDAHDLLVPVIFSLKQLDDGRRDRGFAIVTDDPPPEIQEAGHDRCPVVLERDAIDAWLRPEGKSPEQLSELLVHKRRVTFTHALAEAA